MLTTTDPGDRMRLTVSGSQIVALLKGRRTVQVRAHVRRTARGRLAAVKAHTSDRAGAASGAVQKAIGFATDAHAGQLYGEAPYTVHLAAVARVLARYGYTADSWQIGAWLHDVVEDTGVSIETIRSKFGAEVARLVEAVTTPMSIGNRDARLAALIDHLRLHPSALPLKLADRIANVEATVEHRDPRLRMYVKEYGRFRFALRVLLREDHAVGPMWDRLDELLGAVVPPSWPRWRKGG